MYSDVQFDGFRELVVIGDEALRPEYLDRLCQQHWTGANRHGVLVISAFRSSTDMGMMMWGKPLEGMSYAKWRRGLDAVPHRGQYRCSRLVVIGGNEVVQMLDSSLVSAGVIRGRDPTVLRVGSDTAEILEMRPRLTTPPVLVLYLRTSRRPDVALGKRLVRELRAEIGQIRFEVQARPDSWFIDDSMFPLWFRFRPSDVEPSLEEYKSRGEMWCAPELGPATCKMTRIWDSGRE